MVLKKTKTDNATPFIDASKECVKVANSNKLTQVNIENIVAAYVRQDGKQYFTRLVPNGEVCMPDTQNNAAAANRVLQIMLKKQSSISSIYTALTKIILNSIR